MYIFIASWFLIFIASWFLLNKWAITKRLEHNLRCLYELVHLPVVRDLTINFYEEPGSHALTSKTEEENRRKL
jgi:hypothetical protein